MNIIVYIQVHVEMVQDGIRPNLLERRKVNLSVELDPGAWLNSACAS